VSGFAALDLKWTVGNLELWCQLSEFAQYLGCIVALYAIHHSKAIFLHATDFIDQKCRIYTGDQPALLLVMLISVKGGQRGIG
jgi:hypothetical protein